MSRRHVVQLNASSLPIVMEGVGEEWIDSPGYRWNNVRRRISDVALCQITLHGEGRIKIGQDSPIRLTRGMAFLTPLPANHSYYFEKGSPTWHFVWAMWRGGVVNSLLRSQNRTSVRVLSIDPDGTEVRALRSYRRSHAQGSDPSFMDSVLSYELLLSLCTEKQQADAAPARDSRFMRQLDALYREQPSRPIGKQGIASELKVSRFQLYRAAKRELGVSPKEWIARQKIQEACRLLRDRSLSVEAVARKVGVDEPNYFSRFFRERTGHAPRDWRRLFAGPAGR